MASYPSLRAIGTSRAVASRNLIAYAKRIAGCLSSTNPYRTNLVFHAVSKQIKGIGHHHVHGVGGRSYTTGDLQRDLAHLSTV